MHTLLLTSLLAALLVGCSSGPSFSAQDAKRQSKGKAHLGLPGEEGEGSNGSGAEDDVDGEGNGSRDSDDAEGEGDGSRDTDESGEGDGSRETGGEGDGGRNIPGGNGFRMPVNFYCSEDTTGAIGTDVKVASGVSFKIFSKDGQMVSEDKDSARAAARRSSIIDFKSADLQLTQALVAGSYYAVLCDVSKHSACEIPADRIADDVLDENDGAGLVGVVGFVNNMKVDTNGVLISSGKGQALFPIPADESEQGVCNEVDSPLMVDLTGAGFSFSAPSKGVQFDLNADGKKDTVSWPTGSNIAILALDADKSGAIENGQELFGNHTVGLDGQKAANGFLSLAKHDNNGDGVINASDAVYAELLLWQDHNRDGISSASELSSLASVGIVEINLGYHESSEKDIYGNQLGQRSDVTFSREGKQTKGSIVDAWLRRF